MFLLLKKIILTLSRHARIKRRKIFVKHFGEIINQNTKILDLGSDDGSHINLLLNGLSINAQNIFIADIDEKKLNEGKRKFGYQTILIEESGLVPYADKYFDIVFSSSVIEHVTVPKNKLFIINNTKEFKNKAIIRQEDFANEIRRISKNYFIQTPYKYFFIESHTWLPIIVYFLPRKYFLSMIKTLNKFWIKKTSPDFNLLSIKNVQRLFPEAEIIYELFILVPKSLMAIYKSSIL